MTTIHEFPTSVIEKLGYYVYLLINPSSGETFYVGKGKGNRIFAHLNAALTNPEKSDKLETIRAIHRKGQEVKHIILRHGLTEKEAFEVEAAAIDLLGIEDLTNMVSGHESRDRGWMSITDVIAEFGAKKIEIKEPALLININRRFKYGMTIEELYESTQGDWVLGTRREKAQYAFTVYRGIVRAVFRIEKWSPVTATGKHIKTRERWQFEGKVAEDLSDYLGGDVSDYVSLGNQNPIKYLNC